jgi:hypothetical protein
VFVDGQGNGSDEPDFDGLERLLRESKHEASGLELDQIKQRAMARATRSQTRGPVLRTRFVTLLAVLGLMGAGTGGVIAASHGDEGEGSAAKSEYKPGKGCGDKNHQHARHDECKNKGEKGDDGHGNGGNGHHEGDDGESGDD